jgi:FemAB-related protein (PEP-CTERM system-associated)
VQELTPRRADEWNAYVAVHPEGTFFHTLAWRDAVEEVFAHKAVYLTAVRGARFVGVLPMFLVASRFAGRMLVSVPYGVGGGILAEDDGAVEALFNAARRIAGEYRCAMIDLRSERSIVPDLPTVDRYFGFRRGLPTRADEVLGFLPRKARAAARNARDKFKLSVSFGDEHLSEVWRLYTISMRRLGSLNYSYSFFERLIAHTPGGHWVSIVKWNGRTVAGLVTFLFRDAVMPYFIGTTNEARRCSAANYVYLTAMERSVDEGYRFFDFGRSRRDNTGSFNFKCFQGFEPRPLGYQYYTPPGQQPPNLSPANPKFRVARKVWSCLPFWVTRPLGARLTRHFPG